jgi:hypothetical protein
MLELEEQCMSKWCAAAFLSVALAVGAGQPIDMTGTWQINLQKSDWGSRPRPVSVTLHIQHREPALTYSGMVIYSGEDARTFAFHGAVDGKAYAMDRSFGTGTAVLHRTDDHTFESVFRTQDGRSVETTRTTISRDGKTLTRSIRLQSNGQTSTSTEVYEHH